MAVNLIAETTTRLLLGRQHTHTVDMLLDERDDSGPGETEWKGTSLSQMMQKGTSFGTYKLFISRVYMEWFQTPFGCRQLTGRRQKSG